MSILKEYHQDILYQEQLNIAYEQMRPAFLYKPKLYIDGNQWCALFGDNLQDGVAGFGDSPYLAMQDFDNSWYKKLSRKQND